MIADDDSVALAVMRALLDADSRFRVIGTATTADEAVEVAGRLRPDLVLLDVHMPGGGDAAVRRIAERCPGTRLVAVSGAEDLITVRQLLDAGAHRYAVKASPAEELVELIASAMTGRRPPSVPASPTGRLVKVLLAAGDPDSLLGIADGLAGAPDIKVVGLAQSPAHAAGLAARYRPDVAIVDTNLEPGGGPHATALVRAACSTTRVIGLGGDAAGTDTLLMLRAGARGHVASGQRDELRRAIRAVALGGAALSPPVAGVLIDELLSRLTSDEAVPGGEWVRDRIDRVVDGEGLVTLLQPIVDLRAGTTVGFEALTRFTVGPAQRTDTWFAEAAAVGRGLALELSAARRALTLVEDLPEDSFLSINVSPGVAASPELEEVLAGDLASRVVIEMTEHAPVRDYDGLTAQLRRLRDLGVRVAVDDAGAGFASLRHIVLLEPDFIKLDMSLCRGIGEDPNRLAMARALVSFAAEMGRTVVAEGLESTRDVEALLALDVPLGQGYALGRPKPPTPGRFSRAA